MADTIKTAPTIWICLTWTAIFSLLGLGGNYLALSIGFNVNFIFGTIFGLLAAALLGSFWGVAAALIGSSYTFILWNHPYAIVIFGCEALWLALALKKRPTATLFLIDLAYWCVLGIPLVYFFYYGIMDLGGRSSGIIALKQSLNGVCNALVAGVLLHYLPFQKWLRLPPLPLRSNAQIFFEAMALLLLLPSIGGLIYMNQRNIEWAENNMISRVAQSAHEAKWFISNWLAQHQRATELLAQKGAASDFKFSESLQADLRHIHTLFPDFHSVSLADAHATTVAFDPIINERSESTIGLNFSDRAWFKRLQKSQQTVVSDVFMGRGGIFRPIFTISTPVFRNGQLIGLGFGAVNLDRVQHLLREISDQSGTTLTLFDREHYIIISTDSQRTPLKKLYWPIDHSRENIRENVFLHRPESQKNISIMHSWKEAIFFTEVPIADTDWTVLAEGPLAPLQQSVYDSSIQNLMAIFLLLFITNGISLWVSNFLARPTNFLAQLSASIPEKIESGVEIGWPKPKTLEIATLAENFRQTATLLREKITALKHSKETLETKVAERTAELQTSNDKFKIIFDNEIYAICIFDLQTLRFLDVNNAYEQMYGYHRNELLAGMTIHDITAEHGKSEQSTKHASKNGTIFVPLRYHRKKNGTVFPVEIVGGPYTWNGQRVMFGLAHDISDRITAEKSLRESEDRWQFALEGSGDGVWDWNTVSNKVFFSKQWKTMLGYAEDEIGDSLSDWDNRVHPVDKAQCYQDLNRHFQGETDIYLNEHRVLCKDGSYKWILDRGKVIEWTPDGKPLRVIGTHTDMTYRKTIEEQLRTIAESQRVLLREVNHRVKNNLGLILGMLRLEAAQMMNGACQHLLTELEGRVLALSAVHSMLSSGAWQPVLLHDLCEQIIVSNLPRTETASLTLKIFPSAVTIDASQAHNIAIVINELATNTAKHARGILPLSVVVNFTSDGNDIIIHYHDNGPGYPQALLDGSLIPPGIGLKLVRGIIEMSLAGQVELSNQDGAMTKIRFARAMPEGS
jgi:PAS domain S-box-containing protein